MSEGERAGMRELIARQVRWAALWPAFAGRAADANVEGAITDEEAEERTAPEVSCRYAMEGAWKSFALNQ
jgi:hypothetical protein